MATLLEPSGGAICPEIPDIPAQQALVVSRQQDCRLSSDQKRNDNKLVHLIEQTAAGNRADFKSLYLVTSPKLFGVTLQVIKNRSAAEDILQEVYRIIWTRAATYDRSRGRPMIWLITIARRRAIDELRANPRRTMVGLDQIAELSDPSPRADDVMVAANDMQLVQTALTSLSPRTARAIRSFYFEGLSYVEVAAREGVAVSTLKSLVRRELIKMKATLQPGCT